MASALPPPVRALLAVHSKGRRLVAPAGAHPWLVYGCSVEIAGAASQLLTIQRLGRRAAHGSFGEALGAELQLPPALHRFLHRDLIGVLDVASDGNAGGNTCDLHLRTLEQTGEVM